MAGGKNLCYKSVGIPTRLMERGLKKLFSLITLYPPIAHPYEPHHAIPLFKQREWDNLWIKQHKLFNKLVSAGAELRIFPIIW